MENLMPYSLYKKLGRSDEELIKTKRMVKGIGGEKHIPNKGFALMELTKTLDTAFIDVEVHGATIGFLGSIGFMPIGVCLQLELVPH